MVPLLGLTRYTAPARDVLTLAEQNALAYGHFAISTGDILLGLAQANGVASSALNSLGITSDMARHHLEQISPADEDGPSSYGFSRQITLTRAGMGVLSHTLMALAETGHAAEGQPRTPKGPYLCTGEMLVAIIGSTPGPGVPPVQAGAPDAIRVLNRLGVDRSVLDPVIEQVRQSPADERKPPM